MWFQITSFQKNILYPQGNTLRNLVPCSSLMEEGNLPAHLCKDCHTYVWNPKLHLFITQH